MNRFVYADCKIDVWDGVFNPTETTKIFLDYLRTKHYSGLDVLDLGCGCGVLGTLLARLGVVDRFSGSDISAKAVQNAIANADKHHIDADIRQGSLYEPWQGKKFDLIVCDVSGVAMELAQVSDWFGEHAGCESGVDGTDLLTRIIEATPDYLRPTGTFMLPALSLSNHAKIIHKLEETFKVTRKVSTKDFYLPENMSRHHKLIERLKKQGNIDVDEKFGLYLWRTDLYEACLNKNPGAMNENSGITSNDSKSS